MRLYKLQANGDAVAWEVQEWEWGVSIDLILRVEALNTDRKETISIAIPYQEYSLLKWALDNIDNEIAVMSKRGYKAEGEKP